MTAPEVWLPVVGFEAEYEVSSLGRVRSICRILTNSRGLTRPYGGRVLRPSGDGRRAHVDLSRNNVTYTRHVHLLVCTAFHGPKPPEKDLVAHWDGDGFNNNADNLRWATFSENEEDKRRHNRHAAGERHPSVKLTAAQVAEIRRRYLRGNGVALAREYGVSPTQVSAIVNGKSWSEAGNALARARRANRRAQAVAA